mmetsp:Transcript_79111/g.155235  ORF Transcript_79111/g.155235 Transcript_79111/m.155235 type:complete len:214 (+) Transcript_79111:69-710(+)
MWRPALGALELHRLQVPPARIRNRLAAAIVPRRPASPSSSFGSGIMSHLRAPHPLHGQVRSKITIPEKKLTRRVSRSSGPGGQSVNVSDTRVQLSFIVDKADWIPRDIREKMKEIHKNRISKEGEFTVACQVASSQYDNYQMALRMIEEKIDEAEKAYHDDEWEKNKMDNKEWVIEKMKRDGREKELEKRAEAIKEYKSRSRERTRNKKMSFY